MSHLRQGYGAQACAVQESGAVELLFYDELPAAERERVSFHVRECRECATALEDLRMIREVLASRPDVSAPPAGDWSGFMSRLDVAVRADRPPSSVVQFESRKPTPVRRYIGLLATAALLAIVTSSVYFVARQSGRIAPARDVASGERLAAPEGPAPVATSGIRSAGEKHFERSKLVVLGLANRDATTPADWAYERELAATLLDDTRLYRLIAEQHGMTTLAGVMRDLELVLLETSMAEGTDAGELGQIQRLIHKRNLIEKMDTVATVGM